MTLAQLPKSISLGVVLATLVACGGAAESDHSTQGGMGSTAGTTGGSFGTGGAKSLGGRASTDEVCCNSRPICQNGDLELGSGASCPAGSECYLVPAVCCSPAIYCARSTGGAGSGGTTCDRNAEYNREYQFTNASACEGKALICPANTTTFSNECGCGCEQPLKCPEWIDCMPGPSTPSALCDDATLCPFTRRAL